MYERMRRRELRLLNSSKNPAITIVAANPPHHKILSGAFSLPASHAGTANIIVTGNVALPVTIVYRGPLYFIGNVIKDPALCRYGNTCRRN